MVIRQVAQSFWIEGLHAFSCISPSNVRNVLYAPHPSHLNTLVGMEAGSLAREEGKSARFMVMGLRFRQWGRARGWREAGAARRGELGAGMGAC